MSSYQMNERGQMYDDFARRLGKIVEQYQWAMFEIGRASEATYEVSLDLAVLHCLLAYWKEGIDRMSDEQTAFFNQHTCKVDYLSDISWYSSGPWKTEEHTVKKFLEHLRDAVSHPTDTAINSPRPTTGFIEEPIDPKGDNDVTESKEPSKIAKIWFIDSPDIGRRDRPEPEDDSMVRVAKIALGVEQLYYLVKDLVKHLSSPAPAHEK